MEQDAVTAKLRSAGVPRETFTTTLIKEKCPELRQYITDQTYKDRSIMYVSPMEAELPFYTMAKEMVLAGHEVYCCRLVDIHMALFKDGDDAETVDASLDRAGVIFLNGFMDNGGRSEQFMTPYEIAYFVSWFIRQHQNGKIFVLLGSHALSFASTWWPSSFLAYITKRCVTFTPAKAGKSHE